MVEGGHQGGNEAGGAWPAENPSPNDGGSHWEQGLDPWEWRWEQRRGSGGWALIMLSLYLPYRLWTLLSSYLALLGII